MTTGGVRFASVVGVLALGQDLCFGQPAGCQQRAALIAGGIGRSLGLSDGERAALHWTAQLRFLGCTAHAHEIAVVFGDDIATRARSFGWDAANPRELAGELLHNAALSRRGWGRAAAVVALLAGGRKAAAMNFRTGCEAAGLLGERLALPSEVRAALACSFERWNGSGFPAGLKADGIPIAARVALVAQELEVLARIHGLDEAAPIVRRRAGRSYDPDIVAAALDVAGDLLASLDDLDPWDACHAADPDPTHRLDGEALDSALEVLADFADLKSPHTSGHSRSVAALAAAAATGAGLGANDACDVRRAGLLHDLGRCAVSNAIWDKPARLTRDERDIVETHALRSEQLARRLFDDITPGVADLVGGAHERADGRGYHHRRPAASLPLAARILATADAAVAIGQERSHRPARTGAELTLTVRNAGGDGHLDPQAVDAVLQALGAPPARRAGGPAGLTAREADVLTLLGRGLTTRQIADRLGISPKTADTHIQHTYTKLGISTRGAAALQAMQLGLVTSA